MYSSCLAVAEPKPLDLAGLGFRQRVDEFDRPWIFKRRDRRLDVILQALDTFRACSDAVLEYDMRLDNLAALIVGNADDRAFLDIRM